MRPERLSFYISTLGLMAVSLTSFSYSVRREIRERDKYTCQKCGRPAKECSHFDHDRSSDGYDSPDNGEVLCTRCHYLDHYNRHLDPGLGLSREGNLWALNKIWERIPVKDRRDLPLPESVSRQAHTFR